MKEKIASALKTKYANLGLSQKAFDGVAAILEKTVTNENAIETSIAEDYVANLLKGLQSEFDALRTAKASADKALKDYKEAHPTTTTTTTTAEDEISKKLAALEAKQAEYENRIHEAENKAKRTAVIDGLSKLLKEKGCDNDFIRATTLKGIEVKDGDTAESLLDTYKAEYDNNFKQAYGNGAVPPAGSQKPAEYQSGAYANEVARLRAEGKIPAEK